MLKRVLALAAIAIACGLMIAPVNAMAGESCVIKVHTVDPCANSPQTRRVPVVWYYVREIVPCPTDGHPYIVATNGRLWHDANHRWNWSQIHVGSAFRIDNAEMDAAGVLHGDVDWH